MSEPLTLPICSVQPDFEVSVNDVRDGIVPEETFWLSCYKTGTQSVHGEVHLALNESNRDIVDFTGRKGVRFQGKANVSTISQSYCRTILIIDV